MGWRSIFAAVLLVISLLPAAADEALNVQNLYRNCKGPEGSAVRAVCMGYVSGIGNEMQLVGAAERQHPDPYFDPMAICGEISNGAMLQAFVNWAEKNPRKWTDLQFAGVTQALRETWPCQ